MNNDLIRFLTAEIECLKDELAHLQVKHDSIARSSISKVEVSGFQAPSRDGWLNMLALSDTLSYPIDQCLKAFYGYGIFTIKEIDGIYDAWLVDKQEVNKRISWILEYNDPKRYLDGLIRNAGQFPTEAYPEFNYENYNYEG